MKKRMIGILSFVLMGYAFTAQAAFERIKRHFRDWDDGYYYYYPHHYPHRAIIYNDYDLSYHPGDRPLAMYHQPKVEETADTITVSVQAPGFDKDDLHISALAHSITISAGPTKKSYLSANGATHEMNLASFEYTVQLSSAIIPDKVSSEYINGLIVISAPKETKALHAGVVVPIQ